MVNQSKQNVGEEANTTTSYVVSGDGNENQISFRLGHRIQALGLVLSLTDHHQQRVLFLLVFLFSGEDSGEHITGHELKLMDYLEPERKSNVMGRIIFMLNIRLNDAAAYDLWTSHVVAGEHNLCQ